MLINIIYLLNEFNEFINTPFLNKNIKRIFNYFILKINLNYQFF